MDYLSEEGGHSQKQQDLDEAEEVKRKMIMGGHIEFAVLPKTEEG